MNKKWLIILGVLLVVLIGVSTAGGSRLSDRQAPDLASEPAQSSEIEEQSSGPLTLNTKQKSPFLGLQFQEEDSPEAVLTVTAGEVFSCDECADSADCPWGDVEYVAIEEDQLTLVEGDAVRTGQDGGATIQFGEEVELTLSANTQIRINKYRMEDDQTVMLQVEHLIGEVFFKVNYANENSLTVNFNLIAPIAVVDDAETEDNTAFSGVSIVSFPIFDGLSPEELETQIANTLCLNDECGALCVDENCSYCRNFAELGAVDFSLTDNTGELLVMYINEDGLQTQNLIPGEEFLYEFDGFSSPGTWVALCRALHAVADGFPPANVDVEAIRNGSKPKPPVTTPKTNCGDGVCNIYDKENKNNCPEDCD